MAYAVKEIFLTLQGEGAQAGRRAVFCRFAGCNLWTGREQDRAKAICKFCDTDFVGTDGTLGGKYADAAALALADDFVPLRNLIGLLAEEHPGGGAAIASLIATGALETAQEEG